MHPPTTTARLLHTRQRRALVMHLRQTGATYEAIAHAVHRHFGRDVPPGYDRRDAHRDVVRTMRQVQAELTEAAELVRQMELERLDELQLSVWPAARAGDLGAIHTILRLMERRARLLNLDGPLKVARTTPDGQQGAGAATGMTDNEFAAVLALLAAHQPPQARGDETEPLGASRLLTGCVAD